MNSSLKPILVRKYGGSSLTSVDRIKTVARAIATKHSEGYNLVVVVSAMGSTTDELASLAKQASPSPTRRELDMLLSVGERITMSLLSMALDDLGCPSISYTGSQCGVITDNSHTEADIIEVKGDRVRQSLADGNVVVVAGFQGVSQEKEITTLGRGGSDLTAVALSAALNAKQCEILKDVDGIFTADPQQLNTAKLHKTLSYDELEQIAGAGCGVVHARAVNYAKQHNVKLFVGSSFHNSSGTEVFVQPPVSQTKQCYGFYKPLAIIKTDCASQLEVNANHQNCDNVLKNIANAIECEVPFQEWIESKPDNLRWSVIAQSELISSINTKLQNCNDIQNIELSLTENFSCLSLAGRPPLNWAKTCSQITEILNNNGCKFSKLICSNTTITILVDPEDLDHIHKILHQELLV